MAKVLTMVLAGGSGRRLAPLTAIRAKPAVPFGGRFRVIDFVLSNCVHSGFLQIKVLTQYMSDSLTRHVQRGWALSSIVGHYVDPVPAQQRTGGNWYLGSADAVYQNLNLVRDEEPEHLCVLCGDHVYRMDYRQLLEVHESSGADATVAAIPLPVDSAAHALGTVAVDEEGWMVGFEEKPDRPAEVPGKPGYALCSMGCYLFRTDVIIDALQEDAGRGDSSHDFGHDLLTSLHRKARVRVYDFTDNRVPEVSERERGYWRDVGTLDAYFRASLDLVSVEPVFNLYNHRWPILSAARALPPAKFVFSDAERQGAATDSLVCEGCIVSGGRVTRSILGPNVRVNSWSDVDECILFDGVDVGRGARLRRTIVDKGVQLPPGAEIGFDEAADRARFHVSPEGVVVVAKGQWIE